MLDGYILYSIDLCARAHREIKIIVMFFKSDKLCSPGKESTKGIYNMYVHSWFHGDRKWQLSL